MKINIEKIVYEEVYLNNKQVDEITVKRLGDLLGDGDFIKECSKDGVKKRMLCYWEDTGHGSGLTTEVREVTELDEAVFKVLDAIKSKKKNKK